MKSTLVKELEIGRINYLRVLGEAFLFLTYSGVVYAPGSKNTKTTLKTRGCSFGVPLNTRGCLTRTPHGALKGTKARTRTGKSLYTIPGCTFVHLMQMSDSVPIGVSTLICGGV